MSRPVFTIDTDPMVRPSRAAMQSARSALKVVSRASLPASVRKGAERIARGEAVGAVWLTRFHARLARTGTPQSMLTMRLLGGGAMRARAQRVLKQERREDA